MERRDKPEQKEVPKPFQHRERNPNGENPIRPTDGPEVNQHPEANRDPERPTPKEIIHPGEETHYQRSFEPVSVEQVEPTRIKSLSDFRSGDQQERYDFFKKDLEKMQNIGPVVAERGMNDETRAVFDDWDRNKQLGDYTPEGQPRIRGYTDAYKLNVENDPIKLVALPNGQYEIDGGNHRLFVAQSEGYDTVYARVSRPYA